MAQSINDPRRWLTYVPHSFERLSPLYAHLYARMQQDPEIFALLDLIEKNQPIPVLFFSVISFLVLAAPEQAFAHFYPTLHPFTRPVHEAYPVFRQFCLTHQQELRSLLPVARLQTNEVARCAQLLPAFTLVFQRGGAQPLAQVELGTSAGLNLLWDRYRYRYRSQAAIPQVLGNLDAPVLIPCQLQGVHRPPLPFSLPAVAQRVGIDLAPLNLHAEEDVRWLRACIWPEERERSRRLEATLAFARQQELPILKGDACELLPPLLSQIPLEQTLCVWHSFALNQGPAHVRERIDAQLRGASQERTIYRIALEADPLRGGPPRLELLTYRAGALVQSEWLATCSFHGEEMEWLAAGTEMLTGLDHPLEKGKDTTRDMQTGKDD